MRTSAMHAAICGAVDVLTPALIDIDTIDGPPLDWDPLAIPGPQTGDGRRFVFIGADPDSDDGDSAKAEQTWAGTGFPRDKDENFTISCVALLIDGGQDIRACRGEMFALLTTVETELLAHIDLSTDATPGPVLYAGFAGVGNLRQFYTDRGLTISAQFDIACRAYLTS